MLQRQAASLKSMKWKYFFLVTGSLTAYLCIGALIFRATERGFEQREREKLHKAYVLFLEQHSCVNESEFLTFTVNYFRSGFQTGNGHVWSVPVDNTTGLIWDFPGALTFALTVVTTIGYGHVYPNTELGRGLCIIYALLGIPLTLIFLGAVGDKMIHVASRIGRLKWSSRSPDLNQLINMAVVVMAGIVVMFLLPSVVFHLVEGWSYSRALYYCFITLSTIGFGDDVAGLVNKNMSEELHHVYKAFVYLWILVGLSYLSVVIKFIIRFYIRKADNVKKRVTITMLRGGRQRVIVKKKRFAHDQFIRDHLCGNCFDKLHDLADKGYQMDKIFSYRRKYMHNRMQREHGILRRSKTMAEIQADPRSSQLESEKKEKRRSKRSGSLPNLRVAYASDILNLPIKQGRLGSEVDWEIRVEEISNAQELESEGELVTVRVVDDENELHSLGHDNPVFQDESQGNRATEIKAQKVDDITFRFAQGLLNKGHSYTNVFDASNEQTGPSAIIQPVIHHKAPIRVIFGEPNFERLGVVKASSFETKPDLSLYSGRHGNRSTYASADILTEADISMDALNRRRETFQRLRQSAVRDNKVNTTCASINTSVKGMVSDEYTGGDTEDSGIITDANLTADTLSAPATDVTTTLELKALYATQPPSTSTSDACFDVEPPTAKNGSESVNEVSRTIVTASLPPASSVTFRAKEVKWPCCEKRQARPS